MPKLRIHNFSMSVDGYAAGPDQGPETPLGVGGERLHEWVFETEHGRSMIRAAGGTTGVDDEFLAAGDIGIGATVMGRNMFGPVRGEWGDSEWRGWWGPNPPYHHPVFVLTHHPHDPIEMDGGTTFHFVTDGIEAALERAYAAADGQDVRLGGGSATVQQYVRAGLVDEMHLVIAPTLLGGGERVFDNLGPDAGGLQVVEMVSSPAVVHVRLARP
jgi:dihydrofolate reductase